jgi:P-type E1-E2 ATPase
LASSGAEKFRLQAAAKLRPSSFPSHPWQAGLECLVFVADHYAAALRFHDTPRKDSRTFIEHLQPRHGVRKVMLVSGDRESEVKYLAEIVGITEVHAGTSPEEKVEIVKRETANDKTPFVGDGINDAPALLAATVGVAFGSTSGITAEAADAVVLELALGKIDELVHIGRRMRRIALQSALGGMIASMVGMIFAAAGYLPPIGGAIAQELIDLFAVLNAVRVALPTDELQDFADRDSFLIRKLLWLARGSLILSAGLRIRRLRTHRRMTGRKRALRGSA